MLSSGVRMFVVCIFASLSVSCGSGDFVHLFHVFFSCFLVHVTAQHPVPLVPTLTRRRYKCFKPSRTTRFKLPPLFRSCPGTVGVRYRIRSAGMLSKGSHSSAVPFTSGSHHNMRLSELRGPLIVRSSAIEDAGSHRGAVLRSAGCDNCAVGPP